MTAITVLATVTILATAIVPLAAELTRLYADHTNPIRALQVPTRRNQV